MRADPNDPNDPDKVFSRILEKSGGDSARFGHLLEQLFETMSTGGDFGLETIRHFNGSLFDDHNVLELSQDDVKRFAIAASLDWSAVDPSIFGTLFERGLDPAKRAQLGAHFTSREDIELVVDAVIMTVLRREWDDCRTIINSLLSTGKKTPVTDKTPAKPLTEGARKKARGEAGSILHAFLDRLQNVKVLDPACGSGNFLYVALLRLKDLEKEAILFGSDNGLGAFLPLVGPWQLYGIEINPYAHDLAQMTVWIGWLQWIRANGFGFPADPILRPLSENIRLMDAIIAPDGSEPACGEPVEPIWPKVDFIIGNPPFLGGKMLRRELGDSYVGRIFELWSNRVPAEADLCCYWFEKARAHIAEGKCKRAGLLATQGIRGGANREVLKRIKESGGIFWAESDRPWILDGANVHVSMIAFDAGEEKIRTLDGKLVSTINSNLSTATDITQAVVLSANQGIAFMGDTKVGPFEIPEILAREWLALRNPNGKSNSDVVRPWANGMEITRAPQKLWIVDFPPGMSEAEAAQYEAPFEYIKTNVQPFRATARSGDRTGVDWWIHQRPRPDMRAALAGIPRYIATPCVAKHRVFVWLSEDILADHALIVFSKSDYYYFGVLHSRFHEVWALALGTRLETRPRYTPTTCFETFPFPIPTPEQVKTIAEAACKLDEGRRNWLGDRTDKTRTLTALYNKKPTWLVDAHRDLDAAVAAAYAWTADLSDEVILERLLALNLAAEK